MEYLYFCLSKDLEKFQNSKMSYIPFHNKYDLELKDIKGSKIFFCYSKSSKKMIYCLSTIKNIIYKEEKEYVLYDNTIYQKALTKYSLVELPDLYFIELGALIMFEYEIDVKDLNEKLRENNEEHKDFKFPKGNKNYYLTETYYDDLGEKIEEYIDILNENNSESTEYESKESSSDFYDEDETEEDQKENKDKNYRIMNIPVNLKGCLELDKHVNCGTITKKIFREHYRYCEKCYRNDNNNTEINWYKKKISFRTCEKNKYMKGIMKCYFKSKNYIIKNVDKFIEEHGDINNINIIQLKDDDDLFGDEFFIIYKN
jgi:hypothetical protein